MPYKTMPLHSGNQDKRPSWDTYFMQIVDAVSERATCDRGKSGALIVKDKRIIATGYVGAPSLAKDCYEVGHLFEERINNSGIVKQHCIRTIHAEQNAITSAARYGIALEAATLYCTMEPCFVCAKLIIASGIKRVVAKYKYHAAEDTRMLFKESDIIFDLLNDQILNYKS
ncbi:deoxycytidylate deaminase [Rickettsiales bacterium LUAb2]